MTATYEVTVGNIGTVHICPDEAEAREVFEEYRELPGRAENPVVLWKDGEPIDEYEKLLIDEYEKLLHFSVFKLDITQYVDKAFLQEHGLEKVWEVYVVDTNRCRVHICSMTPNMEAYGIGHTWEHTETFLEGDEYTFEQRDALYEEASNWEIKDVEYFDWKCKDMLEDLGEFACVDDAIEFAQGNVYVG